jgi:glutathione S-transferase
MKPEIILALVTVLASLFTMYLAYNTGMTRMAHKAPAYEATKNKDVLIANRVHMNMLENMVVYLPLLWVAGIFGPIILVAGLGVLWLVSRVWYSLGYLKDPKKRQAPFMLGLLCTVLTAVLAVYGMFV